MNSSGGERTSEATWDPPGQEFSLIIQRPHGGGVEWVHVFRDADGCPMLHVSVPPAGAVPGYDVHVAVSLTRVECGLVAGALQRFADGTVTGGQLG